MIRKATEPDLPRIAEINVYSWRTAYRGIISDEYLFNQKTVIATWENMGRRFNAPGFEIDVFDDGIVKGFSIHHPAEDRDLSNARDLMALYVEPQFTGRGIGSKLILAAEKHAQEKGYEAMVIWTLEKNDRAISFYEKHGYSRDGDKEYREAWGAVIVKLRKGMADSLGKEPLIHAPADRESFSELPYHRDPVLWLDERPELLSFSRSGSSARHGLFAGKKR